MRYTRGMQILEKYKQNGITGMGKAFVEMHPKIKKRAERYIKKTKVG